MIAYAGPENGNLNIAAGTLTYDSVKWQCRNY